MIVNDDLIEEVLDIAAPVSRVWQAIADHKEFGQWFMVRLNEPFELGGKSTGEMTHPEASGMKWLARVEALEPESRFALRWNLFEPEPDGTVPVTTLVEFLLETRDSGTRLTIRESGFSILDEPLRSETLQRNAGGWEEQAVNIAKHLAA